MVVLTKVSTCSTATRRIIATLRCATCVVGAQCLLFETVLSLVSTISSSGALSNAQ